MNKKLVKVKDIEVGKKYTARIPNIFYLTDEDLLYYDYKMLVLAKNRDNIFAFSLSEARLPTRDKNKLLNLKVKDFIDNKKDVVQKYEGFGIVHYFVEKGKIFTSDFEPQEVDFLT